MPVEKREKRSTHLAVSDPKERTRTLAFSTATPRLPPPPSCLPRSSPSFNRHGLHRPLSCSTDSSNPTDHACRPRSLTCHYRLRYRHILPLLSSVALSPYRVEPVTYDAHRSCHPRRALRAHASFSHRFTALQVTAFCSAIAAAEC
jgi:hypothetical protein